MQLHLNPVLPNPLGHTRTSFTFLYKGPITPFHTGAPRSALWETLVKVPGTGTHRVEGNSLLEAGWGPLWVRRTPGRGTGVSNPPAQTVWEKSLESSEQTREEPSRASASHLLKAGDSPALSRVSRSGRGLPQWKATQLCSCPSQVLHQTHLRGRYISMWVTEKKKKKKNTV